MLGKDFALDDEEFDELLETEPDFGSESGAESEIEDSISVEPFTNIHRTVGRNDLCPCGSGKKFKKCCLH